MDKKSNITVYFIIGFLIGCGFIYTTTYTDYVSQEVRDEICVQLMGDGYHSYDGELLRDTKFYCETNIKKITFDNTELIQRIG